MEGGGSAVSEATEVTSDEIGPWVPRDRAIQFWDMVLAMVL